VKPGRDLIVPAGSHASVSSLNVNDISRCMYPYEKQIKDHHEIQPDHPIVDKRIGKYYPQHTVLIMLHATSKAAKVYIMPSFLHGGIDHYFHSMKHFTGASIGFCPI
jgi:hypothetical protein